MCVMLKEPPALQSFKFLIGKGKAVTGPCSRLAGRSQRSEVC